MFRANLSFSISALALAISALGVHPSALAQDSISEPATSTHTLNKVLVSATRADTPSDEVTRPIAVVNKTQLETQQPQSVAQAVKHIPNVAVSGGPRAGNQEINIRGLEGNKVLQVVDGVRQSFQSGHRPSYLTDPDLLRSIEVVKGPASSLWGSGAIGGVVAQNTITASDILKPSQTLGGFVKGRYNSNNDQQTYLAAIAGRFDSLDVLINPYFRDSNDLEQGDGETLENSGKRDHGLLAKAELQLDDDQAIQFSYRQSEESGGIPSNASAPLSSSVFLIDRDTDTSGVSLGYVLNPASEWINTQVSFFSEHIEMQESRVSDGRGDSTELDSLGFSISNQSQLEQITLLYGVDGYANDFKAQRSGTDRPTPPESETRVWGAYLTGQIPLTDSLKTEIGARYDRFETEADNLNTQTDDRDLSPSIALIWQANEVLELTLRHDRAFRAPSSEELYTTGTHFCIAPGVCNTFVSNPELKPEKAANTEIIARLAFEPNEDGGQWLLESSVFENKVDNFIEQTIEGMTFFPVLDAGITTWRNVDEATIKGFELASTYVHNTLSVKVSYGQTRGKDDNTGDYLEQIPADKLVMDVSNRWADESLMTGIRVSKTQAQNRVNDGDSFDGYTLADLYASWSPQALEGLKFDLAVNNVTDRFHRQAWQELYEPGREVILSAKVAF